MRKRSAHQRDRSGVVEVIKYQTKGSTNLICVERRHRLYPAARTRATDEIGRRHPCIKLLVRLPVLWAGCRDAVRLAPCCRASVAPTPLGSAPAEPLQLDDENEWPHKRAFCFRISVTASQLESDTFQCGLWPESKRPLPCSKAPHTTRPSASRNRRLPTMQRQCSDLSS